MGFALTGIGLIMFIIGAVGMGILFIRVFLRIGLAFVYDILTFIHINIFVRHDLEKDGFLQNELQQRQDEINAKEEAKELKKKEEKDEYQSQLEYASKHYADKLKTEYTLADEDLFKEYEIAFRTKTLAEAKEIEKKIKKQHEYRSLANNL